MTDRDSQQFDSKHLKRTNIVREMMETEKTYLGYDRMRVHAPVFRLVLVTSPLSTSALEI